jgi:hypothetical protein
MLQVLDDIFAGLHESAYRGERFAEGPHDDVDFIKDTEMLGGAGARRPQYPDSVGLVYVDPRSIAFRKGHSTRQVREVAFHAEDTLRNDQDSLFRRAMAEATQKMVHVVVTESNRAGCGL